MMVFLSLYIIDECTIVSYIKGMLKICAFIKLMQYCNILCILVLSILLSHCNDPRKQVCIFCGDIIVPTNICANLFALSSE